MSWFEEKKQETNNRDQKQGFSDRKSGHYDKWYRYNRNDDGAAYDRGVVMAAAGKCPENFTLIEAGEGQRNW